jgi:type IV pilus assembly protein PilM
MAKKLTSALGVDIGSRTIKVAEVRSQNGQAVVTAIGMIPTPEGAVDHTGIFNPEAVAAALKQVIADSGATIPQVVASIQGQSSVLVRILDVPRMAPNELTAHMDWELSRNNPFAEANPMKDYAVLADENPASPNMDVVMAIASPHAIETLMGSVNKSGKKLSIIDVEPLGLARSLQTSHGDEYRGQTVCVVNIGHKSTSINIYRDGKLLMPRTVPVGGDNFTRSIADKLSISMSEAEEMKLAKADISNMAAISAQTAYNPFGSAPVSNATQDFVAYNPFADDPLPAPADAPAPMGADPAPAAAPVPVGDSETARVNEAMAMELDEFVAEIRRSIDYYRSRGGDVNRLIVAGGGSNMRGLNEFLGGALGIGCDRFDPLAKINISAKKADPGFLDAHRQEFAVAVGNGLHIMY